MKVDISTSTKTGPGSLCAHAVKIEVDGMLWATRQGCATSPEDNPNVRSLAENAIEGIRTGLLEVERQAFRHGLIKDPEAEAEMRLRQAIYIWVKDADVTLDNAVAVKALLAAARGVGP